MLFAQRACSRFAGCWATPQMAARYRDVVIPRALHVLLIGSLACAPASAQLRVTEPPALTCAPNAVPVVGIALPNIFEGGWGGEAVDALDQALSASGFRVESLFGFGLLDRASIAVEGRVEPWRNAAGDTASDRVGVVRLRVIDLSTDKSALNLDQDRATFVWDAPKLDTFMTQVAEALRARYCQGGKP